MSCIESHRRDGRLSIIHKWQKKGFKELSMLQLLSPGTTCSDDPGAADNHRALSMEANPSETLVCTIFLCLSSQCAALRLLTHSLPCSGLQAMTMLRVVVSEQLDSHTWRKHCFTGSYAPHTPIHMAKLEASVPTKQRLKGPAPIRWLNITLLGPSV